MNTRPSPSPLQPARQVGMSLIELMISITLGMLILAGMVAIFANNSRTRDEIEQMSRQIENGRYAVQLLSDDLQMAGYLGEYVPPSATAPTAMPDPCATAAADLDTAKIVHVQGYNNVTSSTGGLSCISDVKTGTDIIVIRRASTCVSANFSTTTSTETNCDTVKTGYPYLQSSGCASDTDTYRLDTNAANLTLKKIGCVNTAAIRRYRTHIYFVANNNISSDGVPTLKRAELENATFSIMPLAAGIENLQILYGIDSTASPGDGVPDSYTDFSSTAATVTDWWNTMAVKISLLARNESQSTADYSDAKTYELAGQTYGPFNDRYRRHAYTAVVKLANPAGRREQ